MEPTANCAAVSTHLEETIAPAHRLPAKEVVWIPGGTFSLGRGYPSDIASGDRVTVSGFWMDQYPVTNAEFQAFVDATGYITVAERASASEHDAGIPPGLLLSTALAGQPHWEADSCDCWQMPSATWRCPEGTDSLAEKDGHPVVHIAYEDVEAYAQWVGKDIPTEAEWEFAAWGSWQGTEADGAEDNGEISADPNRNHVCPVDSSRMAIALRHPTPAGCPPASRYGLHDMVSTIWEWTADWYCDRSLLIGSRINPTGGTIDQSYDPFLPDTPTPRKVLKGGYCSMVSGCFCPCPAARIAQAIDVSTCHTGFRLIRRSPL